LRLCVAVIVVPIARNKLFGGGDSMSVGQKRGRIYRLVIRPADRAPVCVPVIGPRRLQIDLRVGLGLGRALGLWADGRGRRLRVLAGVVDLVGGRGS
jgi:hypothetical protein